MSDIRQRLQGDIANISWKEIIPHAKRDAVVVIDEKLDLLDVAEAIALDKTIVVNGWIAENLIKKPSIVQLNDWNNNPEIKFTTAIIQPFVIIQAV